MFGLGEELAKEVDCIYALLLFCASPFCEVQWLVGSPFYKAVIPYSLLFQNLDPFFHIMFSVSYVYLCVFLSN